MPRILTVSDVVEPQLYDLHSKRWLDKIDFLISCGDLPSAYLEFLVTHLEVRGFHVLGNHCDGPHDPQRPGATDRAYACIENLHARTVNFNGVLMAGLEGSQWYNGGPHQYSEEAMTLQMWRLLPGLVLNKLRYGRYLDIMVTHSPPFGIGDGKDLPHRGFHCFVDFIDRFQPTYFLHGHVHRYDNLTPAHTTRGKTTILNCYGHTIVDLKPAVSDLRRPSKDGPKQSQRSSTGI